MKMPRQDDIHEDGMLSLVHVLDSIAVSHCVLVGKKMNLKAAAG
jgi:hypothetical protein